MDIDPKDRTMRFSPEEWALLGEAPNNDPDQRVKPSTAAGEILARLVRLQDKGYVEFRGALLDRTATEGMRLAHLQEMQAVEALSEEIMQKVLGMNPPDPGEFNVLEAPFSTGTNPLSPLLQNEWPGDNVN